MRHAIVIGIALTLAACSGADDTAREANNVGDTASETIVTAADDAGSAIANGIDDLGNAVSDATTGDWVGRWTGVEGTYLVVTKDASGEGRYKLEMQYTLDDKGSFDGTATPQGIRFTRPDGDQLLRASDGDATGLKYLAGKKDCLTVKSGEGYCRD